jgi:hypothetical protein
LAALDGLLCVDVFVASSSLVSLSTSVLSSELALAVIAAAAAAAAAAVLWRAFPLPVRCVRIMCRRYVTRMMNNSNNRCSSTTVVALVTALAVVIYSEVDAGSNLNSIGIVLAEVRQVTVVAITAKMCGMYVALMTALVRKTRTAVGTIILCKVYSCTSLPGDDALELLLL